MPGIAIDRLSTRVLRVLVNRALWDADEAPKIPGVKKLDRKALLRWASAYYTGFIDEAVATAVARKIAGLPPGE